MIKLMVFNIALVIIYVIDPYFFIFAFGMAIGIIPQIYILSDFLKKAREK